MRVFVKIYANLTRYVAGAKAGVPLELELPEGATLADLVTRLGIPPTEVRMAFVQGQVQPAERVLVGNDEVGIFPPIGGG
jgi:sulfur carrier protein ThiS